MTRRFVWRAVQVLVLVLVLFGIYRVLAPELRTLDLADFRKWRPTPGRLSVSLVLLVAVYLMHAFLWRAICGDLGVGRPDARTTVRVYFLASLGRYIPGKVWQIAGFAVLAGRAGMPPGGATAAALLGQFAFLGTGLLFVAVMLPQWVSGPAAYILGFILVSAAGTIWMLTATPAGHRSRAWLLARVGESTGQKLGAALTLADQLRGRDAIRWSIGYGASWVVLGIAFSLFTTAFVPQAVSETRVLAGTIAASYLAGYLVLIAPGGIGVRESAMTALLASIPGFPIAAAVVISILSRVWFTVAELLPLAFIPLLPGGGNAGTEAKPIEPEGEGTGAP